MRKRLCESGRGEIKTHERGGAVGLALKTVMETEFRA